MDNESVRLTTRNILAMHSGCTRREAERQLLDVTDKDCQCVAGMNPEDARVWVDEFVLLRARKIVSGAAKEPSVEARTGLSEAAEVPVQVQTDEEEVTDGESESGLDPS